MLDGDWPVRCTKGSGPQRAAPHSCWINKAAPRKTCRWMMLRVADGKKRQGPIIVFIKTQADQGHRGGLEPDAWIP